MGQLSTPLKIPEGIWSGQTLWHGISTHAVDQVIILARAVSHRLPDIARALNEANTITELKSECI
jgi:hypothetical protein